jgi:hypothetical protein
VSYPPKWTFRQQKENQECGISPYLSEWWNWTGLHNWVMFSFLARCRPANNKGKSLVLSISDRIRMYRTKSIDRLAVRPFVWFLLFTLFGGQFFCNHYTLILIYAALQDYLKTRSAQKCSNYHQLQSLLLLRTKIGISSLAWCCLPIKRFDTPLRQINDLWILSVG